MAVSDIPAADLKAWTEFVDERVEKGITNVGQSTWKIYDELYTLGIYNEPTYISKNTPYKISCNSVMGMRISIQFGLGNDSTDFHVNGLLATLGPQLSVHPRSVAAKKLLDILCQRTARAIEKSSLRSETSE